MLKITKHICASLLLTGTYANAATVYDEAVLGDDLSRDGWYPASPGVYADFGEHIFKGSINIEQVPYEDFRDGSTYYDDDLYDWFMIEIPKNGRVTNWTLTCYGNSIGINGNNDELTNCLDVPVDIVDWYQSKNQYYIDKVAETGNDHYFQHEDLMFRQEYANYIDGMGIGEGIGYSSNPNHPNTFFHLGTWWNQLPATYIMSFTVVAVSEPTTITLFSLSLLALGISVMRRSV